MKKFVILTTQRTGSTLLWRYLDQHPEIEGHGEVFLRSLKRPDCFSTFLNNTPFGKIRNILNKRGMADAYLKSLEPDQSAAKAFGFKLMYNQNNNMLTNLMQERDFHVIHLIRQNFLKIVLSRETARARSQYHLAPGEEAKSIKVRLDTETLIPDLNVIQKEVDAHREIFKSGRYMEVHYENLISNKDQVTKSIIEFLGLGEEGISKMEFPLKKINSENLQDLIENFDEVQSVISDSPYQSFLK